MNASAPSGPRDLAHPSPHAHRVGRISTWFAVLGAPFAWTMQQLVNPTMLSHACYPTDAPLSRPIWSNAASVATGIEAAAIVICILAGLVAWRNWRLTRDEKEGSGHHLIESGDGRARFMAMVAMIVSGLFLLATVFAAAMSYVATACGR